MGIEHQNSLISRMTSQIYVLLLCLLVASFCTGVMHRRNGEKRPYIYRHNYGPLVPRSNPSGPFLKVSVVPRTPTMHRGQTVYIKCKVKSGKNIAEYPFIRFFRKFRGNMIMPLVRGIPGVTVRRLPMVHGEDHVTATSVLQLRPEAYYTLHPGYNQFYCKGSQLDGYTKRVYLNVKRV